MIDDVEMSCEQTPFYEEKRKLQRELVVVIGSAQLNQKEKSRQRHIEKNVVEIPRTKLLMSEQVSLEQSSVDQPSASKIRLVNITVDIEHSIKNSVISQDLRRLSVSPQTILIM